MNYNLRVPAAERRKNVRHGRKPVDGIVSKSQPRRGARFLESIRVFRPSGAGIQLYCLPRACARGYILTPLRGWELTPNDPSLCHRHPPNYNRPFGTYKKEQVMKSAWQLSLVGL